mmetsp:Transcript_17380/g.32723  ORF Transcript_17380/g.32723 Transcript_17380/m.32723 type:complete len:256 (+) Transcript_17380:72-839(+)
MHQVLTKGLGLPSATTLNADWTGSVPALQIKTFRTFIRAALAFFRGSVHPTSALPAGSVPGWPIGPHTHPSTRCRSLQSEDFQPQGSYHEVAAAEAWESRPLAHPRMMGIPRKAVGPENVSAAWQRLRRHSSSSPTHPRSKGKHPESHKLHPASCPGQERRTPADDRRKALDNSFVHLFAPLLVTKENLATLQTTASDSEILQQCLLASNRNSTVAGKQAKQLLWSAARGDCRRPCRGQRLMPPRPLVSRCPRQH